MPPSLLRSNFIKWDNFSNFVTFAQYLNFIKKMHFKGEYIPTLYFMNNAPIQRKYSSICMLQFSRKQDNLIFGTYQKKTNMSLSKKSDIIVNTPDFFRRLLYSIWLHYKLGSSKQSCRHRWSKNFLVSRPSNFSLSLARQCRPLAEPCNNSKWGVTPN